MRETFYARLLYFILDREFYLKIFRNRFILGSPEILFRIRNSVFLFLSKAQKARFHMIFRFRHRLFANCYGE